MSDNPVKEIVKPENSIFKGTEMVWCPNHGESFSSLVNTDFTCKQFKSNKKTDMWSAGVQLWRDWEGLNEDYKNECEWNKDLKKERDKAENNLKCEKSINKKLTNENEALKEQINQQHEELQQIKAQLMELLKQ